MDSLGTRPLYPVSSLLKSVEFRSASRMTLLKVSPAYTFTRFHLPVSLSQLN